MCNEFVCPQIADFAQFVDIAKQATVTVSSEYSANFAAGNALDEDGMTAWSSDGDGCDAYISFTFSEPTHVRHIGLWSRQMIDDENLPAAFLTGGSLITEAEIVADGTSHSICTLPNYHEEHYCDVDVTATVFTIKGHTCDSTTLNMGFRSVSLLQQSATAITYTNTNQWPECTGLASPVSASQVAWPPVDATLPSGDNVYDVSVYLKPSWGWSVSGSWVCAIAHSSVSLTNPFGAYTAFLGTGKYTPGNTPLDTPRPWPSDDRTTQTNWMAEFKLWSDAVLAMPETTTEEQRAKNMRKYVAETVLISAMLYRAEIIAQNPEGDARLSPDMRMSASVAEGIFGFGDATGESVNVWGYEMQLPLGTYNFQTRYADMVALSLNGDTTATEVGEFITSPTSFSYFTLGMGLGTHRGHLDIVKAFATSSIDIGIELEENGYPPAYEICETTRGHMNAMRWRLKNRKGNPLICDPVAQRLMSYYSNYLQQEVDLLHSGPAVNVGICTGNETTGTPNLFMRSFGLTLSDNLMPGRMMPWTDDYNDPYANGVWGMAQLSNKTFFDIYQKYMDIHCLHDSTMQTACNTIPGATSTWFFPYFGLTNFTELMSFTLANRFEEYNKTFPVFNPLWETLFNMYGHGDVYPYPESPKQPNGYHPLTLDQSGSDPFIFEGQRYDRKMTKDERPTYIYDVYGPHPFNNGAWYSMPLGTTQTCRHSAYLAHLFVKEPLM